MNFNNLCSLSTIDPNFTRHVWEAQIYDRTVSPEVIRLFHNKIFYFLNDASNCYLNYFSPDFLFQRFTLIGVALFIIGIYHLFSTKKYRVLFALFLTPIVYFPLGIGTDIIIIIVGLKSLFWRK